MGSRYSVAVLRDIDLDASLEALHASALDIGVDPVPLADAWRPGGIAQVGSHVVAVGPADGGPVQRVGVARLAAILHAETCSITASSVVDAYSWSVVDAEGTEIRSWSTSSAGDEVEEDSFGDPLPEEAGITTLDEAAVERMLEARTGISVRGLESVAGWRQLQVDDERLAARRLAERQRRLEERAERRAREHGADPR